MDSTISELALRTFDANDWEHYAGAEAFADGTEPLVASGVVIEAHPWELCIAGNGIMLSTADPITFACTNYVYDGAFASLDQALVWLLELLRSEEGLAAFERAGFLSY
ncbi:MAG: hypothetical protein ACOCXJ_08445 [Planctomycetota bacterium]